MKSKKAQGLSINTVVIVVLALIVLAILAFVVFNTSDSFRSSTACYEAGGRCLSNSECAARGGTPISEGREQCQTTGDVCCRI